MIELVTKKTQRAFFRATINGIIEERDITAEEAKKIGTILLNWSCLKRGTVEIVVAGDIENIDDIVEE